jgi:N-acetylglucosaminyldiphosphoundecaprenol N-acetyl-beta-D-mannosaminyltransferase
MFPLISRTISLSATLASIDSFLKTHEFAHIISLNPENLVEAVNNADFQSTYEQAELVIADGVGILYAAHSLNISVGDRITGVDLMSLLIHKYPEKRILFVGAYHNTAQETLEYFAKKTSTSGAHWTALPDIDKNDPGLIHKITAAKPDLLFVAFGSPAQELWIKKHRKQLQGVVCMGIGQAFNVYGGMVSRAPQLVQALGLEWFYRLITQPWRWRRQLRLLKFVYFVLRYRFFAR